MQTVCIRVKLRTGCGIDVYSTVEDPDPFLFFRSDRTWVQPYMYCTLLRTPPHVIFDELVGPPVRGRIAMKVEA